MRKSYFNMKNKILIFCCLLFLQACLAKNLQFSYKKKITPGQWLRHLKIEFSDKDQTASTQVQIFFPKNYLKGKKFRTLIALHPYNGSLTDWEKYTPIESYANQHDFVLVCPEMGKTVYETKFYPETIEKWNSIPGGVFVGEILIKYLQKNFALAADRESTGIFGVSTGARGAILIASVYNDVFGAVAGLSGNYDSLATTHSKLLTDVYGEYKDFKERWQKKDNIMLLAENLEETSLFLWHGKKDYIASNKQTILLVMKLRLFQKKEGEGYDFQYFEHKRASYGWPYWKEVVPEMMTFFEEKLKE